MSNVLAVSLTRCAFHRESVLLCEFHDGGVVGQDVAQSFGHVFFREIPLGRIAEDGIFHGVVATDDGESFTVLVVKHVVRRVVCLGAYQFQLSGNMLGFVAVTHLFLKECCCSSLGCTFLHGGSEQRHCGQEQSDCNESSFPHNSFLAGSDYLI